MKMMRNLLPLLLAMLLLLSASGGILSVIAISVGDNAGFGTVTESTSRTVAEGLTYDVTTIAGTTGGDQQLHTLTFNPKTSDFMPIVYSQYSGYGGSTLATAKKAETIGYDVKGAVNASFFSMSSKSANTYGGVNISDGKILQGSNTHAAEWVLAFNSDGSTALVQSKVSYSLTYGTKTVPLENINICPDSTTYGGIYYYDTFCGTKTDTKVAGVEVVFEKQNNTELTVGGTLVGKVVEVRKNVSSGGPIGTTQFVLYASDASTYASALRSLAIGDRVEITATETIAASKTVMENCNSALVTYGYHIVDNGKNVTANDRLGDDFNKARAQRTSVGVKEDGTLVIVATLGRTAAYKGLTVYELADYMIAQGCVTAVNLDGGGSSQMTVENADGVLEAMVDPESRRVANNLLIVARPAIDSEIAEKLQTLIESADALSKDSSYTGDVAVLNAALTYAKGVVASGKSMPGDYSKAVMRLQNALDIKGPLGNLLTVAAGISFSNYSDYALENLRTAYAKATEVYNDGQATKNAVDAAYAELKKWIDMTGDVTIDGKKYETVKNGLYLSGFNTKIVDKSAVIYTPGTNIRDMNLTWARVLTLRKDSATGDYLLVKNANGGGTAGVEATVAMLGFDTVPEDHILIVVHGDDGIGKANKDLATSAKIGQKLVLSGIDLQTQTIGVGAYFKFEDVHSGMIGDINSNGKIDTQDYLLLKRYLVGKSYTMSEAQLKVADIDGQNGITSMDYILLKRALIGNYTITDRNV